MVGPDGAPEDFRGSYLIFRIYLIPLLFSIISTGLRVKGSTRAPSPYINAILFLTTYERKKVFHSL